MSLEKRLKLLEKSSKDQVDDLKGKVRCVCLQENPSVSLILLTVEDMAKVTRKVSHEDAETFEDLSRQATRYQAKLNISSLCLSVLGGKAADAISKAVSLKENNDVGNESKIGVKKEGGSMFKRDEVPLSPLSNLYPYQTAGMMYSSAPGFFSWFPPVWGIWWL